MWIQVGNLCGKNFVGNSHCNQKLLRHFSTKKSFANLEQIFSSGQVPARFNFARDVFDLHVSERPADPALWLDADTQSQRWSFAQLHKESIRAALCLQNVLEQSHSSLAADPPVILTILPRIPQWWFLHLGAIRINGIFCPATTQLSSQDIEYRLGVSRAKVIITDPQNMWKVEEAVRVGGFQGIKKIVVGEGLGANGWIQYEDVVDGILDDDVLRFKNLNTKSNDLSQIFFTSGTTGKPKMVGHTHASYGIGHCVTAHILDLRKHDVMWNISDPGWAKSSYSSFFAPWIAGSTVYINQMERFEPLKVLRALRDLDVTTLCAPPTLYRFMVQEKDPGLFKFKSVRNCFGAGEAVNPEVSRQWELKTGLPINEFYGQTETTGLGAPPSQPKKKGSIGKIVAYDMQVVDDDGLPLPEEEEGNIAIKISDRRPVGLFQGYLRGGHDGLEVNEEVNCYQGDYYLTGDRGYLDQDGYMFLVGRADDVINSAGYRIGPYEVESVLILHEAVAESAVVSCPDEERGEIVKAFIVRTEKYRDMDEKALIKDIQEFVKKTTAPYKYPRKIQFVDTLPKTVSGKILRRELRKCASG